MSRARNLSDYASTDVTSAEFDKLDGDNSNSIESTKAPIDSPTFTGTVSGVTASHVGLGNVTNESKATMFSSPTFTGTVSLASGTGINFYNYGAEEDPDNTATDVTSNLLDDYEEGTFTPILKDDDSTVTTSAEFGVYTKIGRTVFVHGYVTRNSTTGYTGAMNIAGLPFNSANITGNLSLTGGYWIDNGSGSTNYTGTNYMSNNSGTIRFLSEQPSGTNRYMFTYYLNNGRYLYFSAAYQAI